MTNKSVPVLIINVQDEQWMCIEKNSGCSSTDMADIYQHCNGVGSRIFFINETLYFDSDAFFNIDLMFDKYDFKTN